MHEYLTKNYVHEPIKFYIVKERVISQGLGRKGFSAALRQIIREWEEHTSPLDNGNHQETGDIYELGDLYAVPWTN